MVMSKVLFFNIKVRTAVSPLKIILNFAMHIVNYSGYHIGEVAVMNLINHLQGISSTLTMNTIVLRADLVVRSSSLKNKPS